MPVTLPLKPWGFFHPDEKKDHQERIDIQNLVASLAELQHRLSANEEDVFFLRHFLRSKDIQLLLRVYHVVFPLAFMEKYQAKELTCRAFVEKYYREVFNKVSSYASLQLGTSSDSAVSTGVSVYNTLRKHKHKLHVDELREIMAKPHFQALLYTHDKVACRDYEPRMFSVSHDVSDAEEPVKIVRIIKNEEPLGATIQKNEKKQSLEIARILRGGAADRSGLVHVGDEICEINGTNVQGRDPKDVVQLLAKFSGPVTLKLFPANNEKGLTREGKPYYRSTQIRLRALFDYDPFDDPIIPCPEAGLPFQKGDVLQIVSQEDPLWWQARKEGDSNLRAGLIPGKQLQERRSSSLVSNLRKEILGRPLLSDPRYLDSSCHKNSTGHLSPCRISPRIPKSKKLKKTMYHVTQNQVYDSEEIITYEEVQLYHPKPEFPRPVVLVGSHGVGRNELKRRLMASNTERFQEVVPYTTRLKKPHEVDGRDYHFVSRDEMEKGILLNSDCSLHECFLRFVEYGEYKGNLYGSSIDSIKCVINSGKVCVLTPHTQALKFLRTADIKPYVIFVAPPSFEILKATRFEKNARHTVNDLPQPFSDEELQKMINTSKTMVIRYGHFFDKTIVNGPIEQAVKDLIHIVELVGKEPLYVPANWVQY
ncbi:MAGUK p55 subfamily member 7 isoform X5 [Octopus sinensis]|uniref:MAGUK p55 subfamily member 7 isoform X5 n=1 Tax=Octopus sinensis TaxID=2607531 RepID=A0A7E6F301_9MOLL|nr:MAGUK p55 subfamily member 7 isoform X5 [Octopus sinensis]